VSPLDDQPIPTKIKIKTKIKRKKKNSIACTVTLITLTPSSGNDTLIIFLTPHVQKSL